MKSTSNKEFHIVVAKLQNLKELAAIAGRSFLQAYPQNTDLENMQLYLKEAFAEKEIESQLLNPAAVFFLMKIGKTNIGYAKLRRDRPNNHFKGTKVVELERFYFLDEYKGKGYGSQLLKYCMDFSFAKGFDWMWLLVWEENRSGIQFYKHKGFEIFDRKIFHFGNAKSDDILMKIKI